jgi:hypothetical protein
MGKGKFFEDPTLANAQEKKEKTLRNQGQEINIAAIKEDPCFICWSWKDGGFDYRPTVNLEANNQDELDRRIAESVQKKTDELGIDPSGYVSPDGKIYKSVNDAK